MKKIMFRILKISISLVLVLFIGSALAMTWLMKEPEQVINVDAPAEKSERPEVVEVFAYSCSHCFSLEPEMAAWVEDNRQHIEFKRVPIVMGWDMSVMKPFWVLGRTYYALEQMGLLESTHNRLFEAIQIERRDLTTRENMLEFMDELGIDKESFESYYGSGETAEKVEQAKRYSIDMGVKGTPTVIVNQSYRVTLSRFEGDNSAFLEEVGALTEKSRL